MNERKEGSETRVSPDSGLAQIQGQIVWRNYDMLDEKTYINAKIFNIYELPFLADIIIQYIIHYYSKKLSEKEIIELDDRYIWLAQEIRDRVVDFCDRFRNTRTKTLILLIYYKYSKYPFLIRLYINCSKELVELNTIKKLNYYTLKNIYKGYKSNQIYFIDLRGE